MGKRRKHVKGGFSKAHSTCTRSTEMFVRGLAGKSEVEKLSPGYISQTKRSANGHKVVKIRAKRGLQLEIRGNSAVQKLRIKTSNYRKTLTTVQKIAEEKGFSVEFPPEADE